MSNGQKRFGTINGVFIPNVLTIFGVILFYREGWVVGNSGLIGSVIIITLANIITLATALSMSSIVTNIKIKGGGAYYIISRSLGPEIGGAIGITLFFAQAFSISFYIIGFTMAIKVFFPTTPFWILNTVTLLVLTLLSIFSAEIAIKSQYIIFTLVIFALFSFFFGNLKFNIKPSYFGNFSEANFWKTFAIFFPAVTGIFAGLSLSGDLKEPDKNIPKGTIAAIVFTYIFYILVAIWFATNYTPYQIFSNEALMIDSAAIPFLVRIGILAATLSSAIGVLLGAPRTLQALSKDEIAPKFVGKGYGPANEPRIAMIMSIIMAETLLLMGSIDFVAQLLTMFFLATYGIVNFIAAIEVFVGNPSYRPKVKVHPLISLLGGIGSFVIMFLIDTTSTIIALIIIGFIYFFLTKRGLEKNWGDRRKGIWASIIEIALANYEKYEEHPRNWRPHVAIFENSANNRELLIDFSQKLIGKSGIISHYIFKEGILDESSTFINEELKQIKNFIKEKKYSFIYPEIIITNKNKYPHLLALQADGIGNFKANTIISDFDINDKSLEHHLKNLKSYDLLKKNVVLINGNSINLENIDNNTNNRIDVWISGFKANLYLMLFIPVLLTKHPECVNTTIFLRTIVKTNLEKENYEKKIKTILSEGRINAQFDIISLEDKYNDIFIKKTNNNKIYLNNDKNQITNSEDEIIKDKDKIINKNNNNISTKNAINKTNLISHNYNSLNYKHNRSFKSFIENNIVSLFSKKSKKFFSVSSNKKTLEKLQIQSESKFFNRILNIFSTLEIQIYEDKEKELINNIIIETSKDAKLVVMGLKIPEKDKINIYANSLKEVVSKLPTTILVKGKYNINLFV